MQFAFTDEQKLIRDTVETACQALGDREQLFHTIEHQNGFHQEAWKTMCKDMGLGQTAVPEDRNGLGLGIIELASIMEKMGRTLLPTPFFTSIVLSATALIKGRQSPTSERLLSEISTGEKIASFAYLDPGGKDSIGSECVTLSDDGTLSGELGFVQYGDIADYVIVLARNTQNNPCLVGLNATEDGVRITSKISMDMTRPISDLSLKTAPIIGNEILTDDPKVIETIFNIGRICLACEQVGASEAILEKTQAFTLERHQFGRPVGSFQAVKHRLADMMVLNEAAKSAAWYAACAADEVPDELSVAAATAMVVSSRALKRNSKHMIQLHGGMGFTWECEAHLYMKRAEMSSRLLGDETVHRETLAAFALGDRT